MNDKVTAVRDVWRYEQGEIRKVEDRMVTEFPLTVILNGSEFVTLVCTPEHIEEPCHRISRIRGCYTISKRN